MAHRSTRRDFLRTTTIVCAGALAGHRLSWAQSPNEKLNLGMIGANGKGRDNTESLSNLGENIVALCDVDEERLAEAAAYFPDLKTFTDWRKLLEHPGIDAVVVSTPDHSHAVAASAAMQLGKHVYCEKPLAHSVWECRVMAERAAKHPKLATQMGNAGHSSGTLRTIVEIIQAGAIGKVSEVHAWTNRPIWPQGIARPEDMPAVPAHLNWDVWLGPAPERPYHPAYHPFNWRGWWDFGTGALGDMGCHIIDVAYWSLKLGAPTRVEAEGEPRMSETGPLWMIARYEFPARAELPPVKLTWYDGGKLPAMELLQGEPPAENGVLFIGEKGTLYYPRDRRREYVLLPRDKFTDYEPPEPTLPRPESHHAEWTEACKTGKQTLDNFAYAGPLTEMVLLGNVAYRLGHAMEWDAEALRVKGMPEAAPLVRPAFRKGWGVGVME